MIVFAGRVTNTQLGRSKEAEDAAARVYRHAFRLIETNVAAKAKALHLTIAEGYI